MMAQALSDGASGAEVGIIVVILIVVILLLSGKSDKCRQSEVTGVVGKIVSRAINPGPLAGI